jgi:iron complex outermembrane receptor protein
MNYKEKVAMCGRREIIGFILTIFFLVGLARVSFGQSSGALRGTVTLADSGSPLHNVSVSIVQLKRTVETNESGVFEFSELPPGRYEVLVHMDGFPDLVRTVEVSAGSTATLDFQLNLAGIREEITVTASGREQSAFDAFQSVTSLDSVKLVEKSHTSLGEVLEHEAGVAKRSFGPGSARPVIRGFDGDRVLILEDGIRTGTLSSQSGEHGETTNVLNLERVEIVKGPATLLYGSNAIGGVVNTITGHHQVHDHPHSGLRGSLTALGGTANAQGGTSGGIEYGTGNWLFWADGGGQRTGDYNTPLGQVRNSKTRMANGSGGLGWFGEKGFFSFGYGHDNARYGVPFAAEFEARHGEEKGEMIDLALRRHNLRFNTGFRNTRAGIEAFRLSLNYTDYSHKELEGETVGTRFDNQQLVYRGLFDQRRIGPLSGSFGFWGLHRNYETVGVEALTPPVTQNAFALFTLQELDFKRLALQFGGRLEHNRYNPTGLRARSFTGFSGAAGIRFPLWEGGAIVVNYTHSYRAPALEELYNNGPHIGNLTFEIGNQDLKRELGKGLDLSLRHNSTRFRAQANFYYYHLQDFVFLAPTGEVEDGLIVAEYQQASSRFIGTELEIDLGLHNNFWLNLGLDAVDAELKNTHTPLPRIPPLRSRVGFEFFYRGFTLRPEVIMARDQNEVFPTESRTAGYAFVNLNASYLITQQHLAHIFSVNAFNLGDKLYRNHLSFIKEHAPEIGRGVRFSYTVRFF